MCAVYLGTDIPFVICTPPTRTFPSRPLRPIPCRPIPPASPASPLRFVQNRLTTLCVLRVAELGPKSNLGRLNSVMKNIGRNVKNSAVVAVERIGAGIHGKVGKNGKKWVYSWEGGIFRSLLFFFFFIRAILPVDCHFLLLFVCRSRSRWLFFFGVLHPYL